MTDLSDLTNQATYRRAGLAVYDKPIPARSALLIMNMQNAWIGPNAPFRAFAHDDQDATLARIASAAAFIREGGGQVVWLRTTTGQIGTPQYWSTYFDHFVGPDKRQTAVDALLPDSDGHRLRSELPIGPQDWTLNKYRFDAFARTDLHARLTARGVDTVIVAGTATNICCESTIREAMSRDYRTFMPHDLVGAPTPDGHTAGLRSVMQAFADIRCADEMFS